MDNVYLLVAIVGAIGFLVSGVTGIIQAVGALSSGSVQSHHRKWLYLSIIAFFAVSVVFGGATYLTARSSSPTPSPTATSILTSSSSSPTPSPTATATPISEATLTATPLPTGVADCSGGQNIGWSKWLSNGKWIDNGTIIVNKPDPTSNIDPTLAGPACGLLKIGSQIRITFTMQGDNGNLYLLVGGTDSGWYGIQFNYGGPNIIENSTIIPFAKQYILRQGNTYTFVMEIATNGNINLLDGNNGPILSYGAAFVPDGHWGLKTFNGTFTINSISV
jgi:hypothetical protein